MAKRIKEKEKSKEQIFDELILENWYLKEVYTYLLKYENEFVNLCDFVRNLDLSSHKIFMLLLPEGQQTIKSIIDERKNFEVFYSYKLNDFELYLTKFIVAHCMFKYYKEDSKRTLFFNQVESITKGKANNYKYYVEYHRGYFCTGNNWGVCADWLFIENKKYLPTPMNKPMKKKSAKELEKGISFNEVLEHLKTLTTHNEKIIYLETVKAEYLQSKTGMEWDLGTTFDQQCDIEIKKLNTIAKLKVDTQSQPNTQTVPQKQIEPIRFDATQTQIVYLFQNLIKEKLINESLNPKLWHLISTYFTDKDNKPLSNIHQTKGNLENTKTGKPKAKADLIEAITKGTKKPS